ncbi:hypothetical protein A4S06_02310 [Erysipelotrichaceae bacterium MTC7]|nr:hypothetical protein A4S06_02310 [Erysipelotrichaceae bacterium MTC7]
MKYTTPIEMYDAIIQDETIDTIEACTHYLNCHIKDFDLVKIDQVKFERCTFAFDSFKKLEILDVIFLYCDVSNFDFEESLLHRVDFMHCKLIGASFIEASLTYVRFQESILRYANFATTKIKEVAYTSCELVEGSFLGMKQKGLSFEQCLINKLDLRETSLAGLDVSNSEFDSLFVDLQKCKGLKIRFDQAASIALMLGLEIV